MRSRNSILKNVLVWCVAILLISSCAKENDSQISNLTQDESNEVLLSWMNLSFHLTQEAPGYTPPISARAYSYICLGLSECTIQGQGKRSMMSIINEGQKANLPKFSGEIDWQLLVNDYMYTICKSFFANSKPAMIQDIENLYKQNAARLSESISNIEVIKRSQNFGTAMAKAIFEFSKTDGQEYAFTNNYPANYRGPIGQGVWNATKHVEKKPLQPFWGNVRTYFTENTDLHLTSTPPSFSTEKNSVFYSYALEVINKARNMNYEEETMVKYWNDEKKGSFTPAGHLMSILTQILEVEKTNLNKSAEAYMKLGIALHDVTVAIWKTKYTFNTIGADEYIRTYIDDEFLTLMESPATPEFSSGQSALASAAAEVLGDIFGHNYSFTDRTYENSKQFNGVPRVFKNFQQMAEEASMANLYGGIHYRFSIEEGIKQGIQIGENINKL